jgi:mono/diheme cytochrome c family protein
MDLRKLPLLFLVVATGYFAYAQQKPKINYVPPASTSVTSGAEMFKAYCAVCHGSDARGDGPAAQALKKQPADLTQLSKKNAGQFPGVRVMNVIEGKDVLASHGSRDMPIWGTVLRSISPDEDTALLRLHNLANYIGALQQN